MDLLHQMADDAGDGSGEHVHHVGIGALPQDIGEGQGVQHEKALDGQKPQLPGPANQVWVRGYDAVRLCAAGDVLGGNILGGHALHQINVDKGQLSRLLDPLDQLPEVRQQIQARAGRYYTLYCKAQEIR